MKTFWDDSSVFFDILKVAFFFAALVMGTDTGPPPTVPTIIANSDPNNCTCAKSQKSGVKETDDVRQDKIDFEDALQNALFIRRWVCS